MRTQIYVPPMMRDYHKRQIREFVWPFFDRLSPVFADINREADEHARQYFQDQMQSATPDSHDDPSLAADSAIDVGVQFYEMLSLGRYVLAAAWHSTLAQFFEQQVRRFLFGEIGERLGLPFRTWCTNWTQIEEVLESHGIIPTDLRSWNEIVELRALCNVIKHGDGSSAAKLRKTRPDLFRSDDNIDHMALYKTTLAEPTLDLSGATLRRYVNALELFWDEIPERSFSTEHST